MDTLSQDAPRVVTQCDAFPHEAVLAGGSSGVVDTRIDLRLFEGRLYIDIDRALAIGEAVGMVRPQAKAAYEDEIVLLEARAGELEDENRALKAALESAESLRKAVGYTLSQGVVADVKSKKIELRALPGQGRVDLNESLYQGFVESWPVED